MSISKTYERLSAKQVLTRVFSVVICGAGVAACAYSLSLQIQDVGNLVASLCWFTGLGAVVVSIAGYVVTCGPQFNNRVAASVVVIFALAAAAFVLERQFLWVQAVILATLVMLAVEIVVLIVYHQILKREDPLAE